MNSTNDKREFVKLQTIHLYVIEKKPASEKAKIVNKKVGMIYQIAHRYKKFGLDGLINKPRGGRKWSFMTFDEEKKLLESLTDEAKKGLVVISKIVRNNAEEKLGHPVSADYAEDLLNRHGWRKIMPKTKHPKSSPDEQEEFKKKCPQSSKKQQIRLTRKIIDL
jgi:transposase